MFLINGQNLYTEHNRSWLISTNILTSSQLACWLSWLSSALVSQRSGVQIPNGPEFFSGLISTISSVVFLSARISYIRHPLISCASLHFRKRAGNQSKRVKLKTGSTVFRQKQTHVELMSETVRQFFFFFSQKTTSFVVTNMSWYLLHSIFSKRNPWVQLPFIYLTIFLFFLFDG